MSNRKDFMTASASHELGNLARTHQNCLEKTGVARPGKTAQERARRGETSSRRSKPVETQSSGKSKKKK